MSGLIDKAKNFVSEKVADMPKPEASIEDVDLKGVSKEGVDYHAKLAILNPYSQSLPICDITYVLKSDGRVILSGSMPDPGSIRGKDTTIVDLPLKVPQSIIVNLVSDIFRDWDIDYELEVGLIIDLPIIGNFTIPLSSKGEIKLPSIKDFFRGGEEEANKD